MKLDLYTFLDFVFPPSEDEKLLRGIDKLDYRPVEGLYWCHLSPFQDKQTKAAIHLVKYHNHNKAKRMLANNLLKYLKSIPEEVVIIPIPLSKNRQKQRGYNQVTEVIKLLDKEIILLENFLYRPLNTKPQSSLSRSERLENINHNTFKVRNQKQLHERTLGKTVFLVDDVVTTGTTLKAAKVALSPHINTPIICLAFAH